MTSVRVGAIMVYGTRSSEVAPEGVAPAILTVNKVSSPEFGPVQTYDTAKTNRSEGFNTVLNGNTHISDSVYCSKSLMGGTIPTSFGKVVLWTVRSTRIQLLYGP